MLNLFYLGAQEHLAQILSDNFHSGFVLIEIASDMGLGCSHAMVLLDAHVH